jgi:hypothetical protein
VEAPGDHVIEACTKVFPEAIEAVVAQDLAPGALDGSLALARADKYDDLAFRHASDQALDERRSKETRGPGHGDPPTGELVGYHECVSSTELPRRLTISTIETARDLA